VSLQAKILSLISGITDPTARIDIASTINYLFQIWIGGHAQEKEIRSSLFEVCFDVISGTHPELTEEEVRRISNNMTNEFMRLFKIEGLTRRMMARFRPRTGLPL